MPRSEPGVAAFLKVGGWPAPVLDKEQRKATHRRRERVIGGVHRTEDGVCDNARVEPRRQLLEEHEAANTVVQAWLGHEVILGDGSGAGGASLRCSIQWLA